MKKLLFLLALFPLASIGQIATDGGPASAQTAITPSDITSLLDGNGLPRCRALWVTETGDVVIQDQTGISITYPAVPAHTLIPFRPAKVMAATTATVVCWRS
jgi:hypothetical protein